MSCLANYYVYNMISEIGCEALGHRDRLAGSWQPLHTGETCLFTGQLANGRYWQHLSEIGWIQVYGAAPQASLQLLFCQQIAAFAHSVHALCKLSRYSPSRSESWLLKSVSYSSRNAVTEGKHSAFGFVSHFFQVSLSLSE